MSNDDDKKQQRVKRRVGELLGFHAASMARAMGVELVLDARDDVDVVTGVALELALHEEGIVARATAAAAFEEFAARHGVVVRDADAGDEGTDP